MSSTEMKPLDFCEALYAKASEIAKKRGKEATITAGDLMLAVTDITKDKTINDPDLKLLKAGTKTTGTSRQIADKKSAVLKLIANVYEKASAEKPDETQREGLKKLGVALKQEMSKAKLGTRATIEIGLKRFTRKEPSAVADIASKVLTYIFEAINSVAIYFQNAPYAERKHLENLLGKIELMKAKIAVANTPEEKRQIIKDTLSPISDILQGMMKSHLKLQEGDDLVGILYHQLLKKGILDSKTHGEDLELKDIAFDDDLMKSIEQKDSKLASLLNLYKSLIQTQLTPNLYSVEELTSFAKSFKPQEPVNLSPQKPPASSEPEAKPVPQPPPLTTSVELLEQPTAMETTKLAEERRAVVAFRGKPQPQPQRLFILTENQIRDCIGAILYLNALKQGRVPLPGLQTMIIANPSLLQLRQKQGYTFQVPEQRMVVYETQQSQQSQQPQQPPPSVRIEELPPDVSAIVTVKPPAEHPQPVYQPLEPPTPVAIAPQRDEPSTPIAQQQQPMPPPAMEPPPPAPPKPSYATLEEGRTDALDKLAKKLTTKRANELQINDLLYLVKTVPTNNKSLFKKVCTALNQKAGNLDEPEKTKIKALLEDDTHRQLFQTRKNLMNPLLPNLYPAAE